jgi:hypothetical protein
MDSLNCSKIAGAGGDLRPRSYDPGQREPESHDPNVESETVQSKALIKVVLSQKPSWTRAYVIHQDRLCEVNLDQSGSDQSRSAL